LREHLFYARRIGSDASVIRVMRYLNLTRLVVSIEDPDPKIDTIWMYPAANLAQDETHRIAIVIDPSFGLFGRIGFWVNGTETDVTLFTVKPKDMVVGQTFVSQTESSNNMCLRAQIYSIKVFNRPLKSDEVIQQTMQLFPAAGYTVSEPVSMSIFALNGSQLSSPFAPSASMPILMTEFVLFNGTGGHKSATCQNLDIGKLNPTANCSTSLFVQVRVNY
jgi:hypothetical protein